MTFLYCATLTTGKPCEVCVEGNTASGRLDEARRLAGLIAGGSEAVLNVTCRGPLIPDREVLAADEAAAFLGFDSSERIYQLVNKGIVKASRVPGSRSLTFTKKSLLALLAANEVKASMPELKAA